MIAWFRWLCGGLLGAYIGLASEAQLDPAGHWEGTIQLPATVLQIRVDLRRGSPNQWEGTIDIPAQGLRGYRLDPVTVGDRDITLGIRGVPGEPVFQGQLAETGNRLTGNFTQAGQRFPFTLNRAPKPPATGQTPAQGKPGKGWVGFWQGSLRPVPVMELRLSLELTNRPAGGLGGVMVSLDQGAVRLAINALSQSNDWIRFEVQSVGGSFQGQLAVDGSEIAGQWTQGGQRSPLVFKRLAEAPRLQRPQEPSRPYPYLDEDLFVTNAKAKVRLAATLTYPRGPGPFPAVVLISGSGPQDRDESVMAHRPFLVLSDYLTRHGIAVLRYDDRGTFGSTGDFAKATSADFVEDALAAFDYLQSRREMASGQIGLLGHSEGGIVAPLAAVRQPAIAFIVLLAGMGVPAEELLLTQARDIAVTAGAGEQTVAANAALQKEIFRILREEPDPQKVESRVRSTLAQAVEPLTAEQRAALGLSESAIETQVRNVTSPWFRDFVQHDPRPTLRAVKCPVLAVNGEKDLQVAAKANLEAIRQSLEAGGNRRFRTVELPGLNHLFQTAQTGAVGEYATIEETMNPAALELVATWILENNRERSTAGRHGPNSGAASPPGR